MIALLVFCKLEAIKNIDWPYAWMSPDDSSSITNDERLPFGPQSPPPLSQYTYKCDEYVAFQHERLHKRYECKQKRAATIHKLISKCLDTASTIMELKDAMNEPYLERLIFNKKFLLDAYEVLEIQETTMDGAHSESCEHRARETHMENIFGETCYQFARAEYTLFSGSLKRLTEELAVSRRYHLQFQLDAQMREQCEIWSHRSYLSRAQARTCMRLCNTLPCTEKFRVLAGCDDILCWRWCTEEDKEDKALGFHVECVLKNVTMIGVENTTGEISDSSEEQQSQGIIEIDNETPTTQCAR